MDIISRTYTWFLTFLGNLDPAIQSFFIRTALVLVFSCLLPAAAFVQEARSALLQRFLLILGIFIGGIIPIKWLLELRPEVKSYVLTLCLFAIGFLPLVIPYVVARTAGGERVMRLSIAIGAAVLLLINIFVVWLS